MNFRTFILQFKENLSDDRLVHTLQQAFGAESYYELERPRKQIIYCFFLYKMQLNEKITIAQH